MKFAAWMMPIALLSGVASAAKGPNEATDLRFKPVGPWNVESADWSCKLNRKFSGGGKSALFSLSLEPITSTSWFRFGVEAESDIRDDDNDAVLFIDGNRAEGEFHYNIFSTEEYRVREYMLDLNRHPLGDTKDLLRFSTSRHGDIELDDLDFQPAWRALRTCMDDLYGELDISSDQLAKMKTEPTGDVFKAMKIPRGFGSLDFALLYWISEDGRVDQCRLLLPSGNAKIDEKVCDNLKAGARFKPALDAEGEPIRVPQYKYLRLRTTAVATSG